MKKIDKDTIEASRVHGKDYASKVAQVLSLARAMSCENYGYDWPDYRRIVSQRSRALAAFRRAAERGDLDLTAGGNSRLSFENGACSYVIGQSGNEEITNLLRAMARRRGGWVS